eukprot:UN07543
MLEEYSSYPIAKTLQERIKQLEIIPSNNNNNDGDNKNNNDSNDNNNDNDNDGYNYATLTFQRNRKRNHDREINLNYISQQTTTSLLYKLLTTQLPLIRGNVLHNIIPSHIRRALLSPYLSPPSVLSRYGSALGNGSTQYNADALYYPYYLPGLHLPFLPSRHHLGSPLVTVLSALKLMQFSYFEVVNAIKCHIITIHQQNNQ